MLKVNLYNIKMILSGKNGINTILDNYETDILEIFNTIEDIYTNYWQDGISLRFKDENYDYYRQIVATVKNSQASKIFGVGSTVNFDFEF